ncbi:MAG: hypothetical protein K8T91_04145 [Planctomycetes bacterium]|nr:hypothetical protein [Planctomycetota bacterium]
MFILVGAGPWWAPFVPIAIMVMLLAAPLALAITLVRFFFRKQPRLPLRGQDETGNPYPSNTPRSTADEFIGQGWSVRALGGKFYFAYISGELAGRKKEIEISESDFQQAKSGNIGFDELCIKYDVS